MVASPKRPLGAYGCGCQNRFGIPVWLVFEFATHFRTYFGGDWDVHFWYDLDFDPWPYIQCNWVTIILRSLLLSP